MSANHEMYGPIVNAVPEGIWVVDPQGQTIFCNGRMAEILGTDVESLQRLSCFDPVFPSDLEEAQRQFGLQMAGGREPFDFRLRRIDGSPIWVSISCRPMYSNGLCIGLLGLFTDISERRRAEKGLRDREELFRAIFSQAAVGITQCSVTGECLLLNDRYCEIVGYTRAELRGKTVFDITHPDDRETCIAAVERLLAGEIPAYSAEKRYIRKDGAVIWVRLFVNLVWDADKRLQYFIGVVEDITETINAERARQESEQRLALAQTAAHLGVWDCDLRTNVTVISAEYARLHGLEPGRPPLTHEDWLQLVHPADRARVEILLRESYDRTHLWDTEFRILWPDGSEHWLLAKGKVFLDDSGLPVRMAGVSLDITERKRTEEALRQSEERFRLAIRATNDAIWDTDLETGTVTWNETYSTLYGRPPTSDSWQWWIARIHAEDRERTVGGLHAAISSGASSWSCEYRFQRADGGWAYIYDRAYIARDESGNAWRVIGAMQDLTERKRAESALRESEERFRRVFEEGPLGIALVGKNYHFVKVNSALCQMVGYSEAELLQKSFVDITHPDDVQADVELAQQLLRGVKPFYKLRKRYVKKNGELVWINLTASLIRDKEGKPIHGLAMVEDITEVKRAQEEAFARQKLESVGVLAGGIAHDFNNLLGGILASTELALTECAEGSSVKEELQRIKTSSVRGAEIVRELMIYGGEESPNLELVDMSALVNEMLQLLKVSISKHAILKIELGQDLPAVQANPAQIRQVVMNLVTNASEALGERSGEIRVTSGTVKVGPNSPARGGIALAEGDYLRLEVFDTGRGMTPEVQARIFDPFFSTKRAGRGLGLAAVQGVIRSHGGMINVESAPGQGSRFEILLPCFDQAAQKTKGIPVTPSAQEPGTIARTVLVIEDEETLRLAVSKMLRKAEFSVIEAGDGTTGVNLFRANKRKIDVVLLDMTLPGMSGREVLEELRRIQPGVKVILTTAFSQASTLSSIAEQHLWGFVRKPYQLSELTSLLRKACLDEPKITGHAAG